LSELLVTGIRNPLMRYLNSQKLQSEIANHTIPILQYGDWIFVVLPYLGDDVFDELLPFNVVGEVTCFIDQTLEYDMISYVRSLALTH